MTAAIERIRPGDLVVDVGCGSGAIAITLALETRARVWAIDISSAALAVALRNADNLGSAVRFCCADLIGCFPSASLDVVASNPPYVGLHEADGLQREVRDHEPHLALFGGEAGTEIYDRLVVETSEVLKPGGWLILELGWKSLDPVTAMLRGGWSEIETISDLAGFPRVLAARWTP